MKTKVNTREAAAIIGCSPQQVRTLIRSGRLKATPVHTPFGHYFELLRKDVEKYRDIPQLVGYPRGRRRVLDI